MKKEKIYLKFLLIGFILLVVTLSYSREPHLQHHEPLTKGLKSTQTYIHDLKNQCIQHVDSKVYGGPFCSIHFTTKDYNSFSLVYPLPKISAGIIDSFFIISEVGALPGMTAYGGAKFSLSNFGIMNKIQYITTSTTYFDVNNAQTDVTAVEKGYYALKDAKGNYWAAYKLYTGNKSKWYVGSKVKNYWLHCKSTDNFSREYGCYGNVQKYPYKTKEGIKYYYYDKNNKRKIYPLLDKPLVLDITSSLPPVKIDLHFSPFSR